MTLETRRASTLEAESDQIHLSARNVITAGREQPARSAMSPATCAICDVPITPKNDSREHIILNALGGRRTVNGFICGPCNVTAGHTWDAALAKQLNPFSLFFHVSRQNGDPPAQNFPIATGGTVRITHAGLELPWPTVEDASNEDSVSVQIVARTNKEARRILKGLKKKYPQLDVEAALAASISKYSYLDGPVMMNVQIGGPDGGRSIVKSAFALAVASGAKPSTCDEAKRYLASGEKPCFGYFNEIDLLDGRPKGQVVHCVAVRSTNTGLLLGYVELFSVFRTVVCLSSDYNGAPIDAVYAIDPVTGSELPIKVRLEFSREDLNDIYEYRRVPDGAIADALNELMPDAMRRQFEREKETVIDHAVQYAWRKLGLAPSTRLTEEHVSMLTGLIMERMRPFFLRHIQNLRALRG